MRKFLVAVFVCASVAAYAQVQSYYQFTDANNAARSPEVFNCITSSPGLICPGFVQTDVNGNPIGSYNVLPTNAAQWGYGATGAAPPTTASYMAVTSGGLLQGWDRTVRTDPQFGFDIRSTTAQSISVNPVSAAQWGNGATGSPPPTTAHYIAVTSGGNLTGWDRSVRQDTVPWSVSQSGTFTVSGSGGFNINSTTAQSINVAPVNAAAFGAGATGAPPPTTAMYNGVVAYTSEPGQAANANLVGVLADLVGKLITQPYASRENFISGQATNATTQAFTVIASQGSNVRMFVTSVECGRLDAGTTAMTVTIGDLSSTKLTLPNSGGGGGNNATFPVPLIIAANTALQMTLSDKNNVTTCSAQGYKGY